MNMCHIFMLAVQPQIGNESVVFLFWVFQQPMKDDRCLRENEIVRAAMVPIIIQEFVSAVA